MFLTIVLFNNCFARPDNIEMWFLSKSKVSLLQQETDHLLKSHRSSFLVAEVSPKQRLACQKIDGYCFDPQYGLYKDTDKESRTEKLPDKIDHYKVIRTDPSVSSQGPLEKKKLPCDSQNHFDIFCGKEKINPKKDSIQFEIWVDISSSMKEFDSPNLSGGCFRKSFLEELKLSCGLNQKFLVRYFNEHLKESGTLNDSCQNSGTNHLKNLKGWIERSTAKKLIIISDVYELQVEITQYIESIGGKIRGDSSKLLAKDLSNFAKELASSCH